MRVRFAPAPTGYLHLGGARTALFNWLLAKQHQGKFILRVEDTDIKRSTQESVQVILDSLNWLGITWDEGPYFQSERIHIYKEYIEKLLQENKAYYCYCTPEELKAQRQEALESPDRPAYDGRCQNLSLAQRQEYESGGRKPVVRFQILPGMTTVNDLIRGELTFDNKLLGDFIILKSDGMPTYNFACIIDDALMEITHVIRGEDHISNTPRQILLSQALGFKLPIFAHLPLILGTDKTPLSKRHGDVAIGHYIQEGYLPEALVNYLALLGWSTSDSQQIISGSELVVKFSLERVSKNPAIFDLEKLRWLNGEYIKGLDIDTLTGLCGKYLNKIENRKSKIENRKFKEIVRLFQERMRTLGDFVERARFFFVDTGSLVYEPEAMTLLTKNGVSEIMEQVKTKLSQLSSFTPDSIEMCIRRLAEELRIKAADIIHPLRAALTGSKVSPGIFEVVALLGKKIVTERISKVLKN
ncbi:MAG: glutamate--tRNA ligase [bacterium]|nr:glutamate--tRNA ligase [bacterium]